MYKGKFNVSSKRNILRIYFRIEELEIYKFTKVHIHFLKNYKDVSKNKYDDDIKMYQIDILMCIKSSHIICTTYTKNINIYFKKKYKIFSFCLTACQLILMVMVVVVEYENREQKSTIVQRKNSAAFFHLFNIIFFIVLMWFEIKNVHTHTLKLEIYFEDKKLPK